MTYLPVTPETGVVHQYAHPGRPSIETTRCMRRVPWVRSLLFIDEDEPLCEVCFPNGWDSLA